MNLSHLSPNFIIPKGTQVVLRCDEDVMGAHLHTDGSHLKKKRGSVGVIETPPLTNDYAYVVGFSDGHTARVKKVDLIIRREDSPEEDFPQREVGEYEKHLIYKIRAGSHAFGLANEQSDLDERGVFLPPAEWQWSLQPLPEQIEFKRTAAGEIIHHNSTDEADDVCWFEIAKFVRLALKANPNILEALYVPEHCVLSCDAIGRKLRDLRGAFLSRYIYQTYSGYVLSQFKKMKGRMERGFEYKAKHAMHLIRLLYSGIEAMRGHGILVDVGEYRAELLRIKQENRPFDDVMKQALTLVAEFEKEYERTSLPERPDCEAADRFLIEARRSRV